MGYGQAAQPPTRRCGPCSWCPGPAGPSVEWQTVYTPRQPPKKHTPAYPGTPCMAKRIVPSSCRGLHAYTVTECPHMTHMGVPTGAVAAACGLGLARPPSPSLDQASSMHLKAPNLRYATMTFRQGRTRHPPLPPLPYCSSRRCTAPWLRPIKACAR